MKSIFLLLLLLISYRISGCELTVRLEAYAAQSQLKENVWHGLDVELVTTLLNEAKCQYSFIDLPWGRSLKLLESGDIDLMLSVSKTSLRESFAYFIGPQRTETIIFASHSSTTAISTLDELFAQTKPFAIQRGAFYGAEFNNKLNQREHSANMITVTDNQTKLELLRSKRISGYLEAKLNVLFEIENVPELKKLQIHPVVINQAPVYFAVSKNSVSKEQISQLEAAFNKLKHEGKFATILAKYDVN